MASRDERLELLLEVGRLLSSKLDLPELLTTVLELASRVVGAETASLLLLDEKTGELTARGTQIVSHTPAGRFGTPEDLLGALVWLVSPSASFVSGIVVPVEK